MSRTLRMIAVMSAFVFSAQARDFFNCPIYPVAPEPPPRTENKPKSPPPHQKTHEETFKETRGSGYSGDASVPHAILKWQSYADEARRVAAEKDRAYVLYFCDAHTARVAGEGRGEWDKIRKEHNGAPQPTIFDSLVMLRAFETAGVGEFVKVVDSAENQALYKKYEATRNMLVFCAPDGDRLAVFPSQNLTQTNVVYFLEKCLPAYMGEWRQTVKAEAERAAAEQKARDERDSRVAAIRARQAENSAPRARPGDEALAQALPKIVERLANLELCAKAAWMASQDKDKKELHPIKEAGELYMLISDLGAAEGVSSQPPALLEGLYESRTRSMALLEALKSWARAGTPADGVEKVSNEHRRLVAAFEKIRQK